MKFMKMVSVVALLGVISASQVKASVYLPGDHNLTSPGVLNGSAIKSMGQPMAGYAVPEPSDWAWVPVLGTIGVIAWRRLARRSAV